MSKLKPGQPKKAVRGYVQFRVFSSSHCDRILSPQQYLQALNHHCVRADGFALKIAATPRFAHQVHMFCLSQFEIQRRQQRIKHWSTIKEALKADGYRSAIERGERITDKMLYDAIAVLPPLR